MTYSTLKFLQSVDEGSMPISAKLIRESMLNGTYPSKQELLEDTANIVSIDKVKEKDGEGLSVKQADGHEYRYAVDDTNPKYTTIDDLLKAAQKLLKFRSSGAVLGWLHKNAILYFGSKREAKKQQQAESLSSEVTEELTRLVSEIHPEYKDTDLTEAVEAVILELDLKSDQDYFKISPKGLKRIL